MRSTVKGFDTQKANSKLCDDNIQCWTYIDVWMLARISNISIDVLYYNRYQMFLKNGVIDYLEIRSLTTECDRAQRVVSSLTKHVAQGYLKTDKRCI